MASSINAAALKAHEALELLRKINTRTTTPHVAIATRRGRRLAADLTGCLDAVIERLTPPPGVRMPPEVPGARAAPVPLPATREEAARAMWAEFGPHFEVFLRSRGTTMAEWLITKRIPDADE